MKYKSYIIEASLVVGVLAFLAWVMIPRFLAVQNINTPKNFPDLSFRAAVEKFMGVEPGGRFTANEAEAKTGTLNSSNMGVMSIKGIEHFPHIQEIHCANNPLRFVNLSQNTELTGIWLSGCDLKELDLSKNPEIQKLGIENNLLENIDLRHQTKLKELRCNGNQFQFLNLSYCPNLTSVVCDENRLKELDVSNNSKLTELRCFGNNLTTLNLSGNPELESLTCSGNLLESIRFPTDSSLKSIQSQGNKLESIDLALCDDLESINLSDNRLLSLPDFSRNLNLHFVDLRGNQLNEEQCAEIDDLHRKLGDFRYTDEGPHMKGIQYQPQANGVFIECSTN